MLRRRTATLTLMTAALALVGSAHGASIVTENGTKYAYYELVNTRPTAVSDQVVAGVVPPSAVVAADPNLGPFTIVKGSSGFDANNLYVTVANGAPGSDRAALLFDFTPVGDPAHAPNAPFNPLAAGGVLNFKVSLDPNYSLTTVPTLTLQPPDADLVLFSYTPVAPNAAPGASNTPEPASMALWSALAGAGLIRVRAYRRARARASTTA